MKPPRDYLSRTPVGATLIVDIKKDENEYLIAHNLPEGFTLENGVLRFSAGSQESYLVNGKEYNVYGNVSVDAQKELIIKDLSEEGFTEKEAREFVEQLPVREWAAESRLDHNKSNEWLDKHPKFKQEALEVLKNAKIEAEKQIRESEINRSKRK
ncbi:MAG: hypothetical protein A2534_04585 [Candidatus Magasanikbacteria bacterium RIFOXYD2_FULL_39_9]|uniref:Uncharacterized protein n=1 Tax=Candidatus Magasanikbacteria bacterium RIFOXYD1_FULL_40_23 TaxID=1798705 RepID=A0A1F6PAW2_9BACT|nr:MAG: hypothetical protein A2534_04585 [Candidatus Magasanikbacteria bacterium RIFOXYD2_FULL_39_9]OGH93325.1 MAG: hypothetical protein A2563_01820 [Candidatus Magasanikbacteria bacterium RIFOXYD1_FULL_40_23]